MNVCAVFDIGKTNKKLLCFNENYEVIIEKSLVFDELLDDEGEACDDLMGIQAWILNEIKLLKSDKNYTLKAINFSAYGASLVYLDRDGKPVAPLYNYLKTYDRDLKKEFLETYNSNDDFFNITASPDLGMLNSGLQLYWLKKHKTNIYKNVTNALHLPQYLSFIITKTPQSELTSLGCHTGMWNFKTMKYMDWLEIEKIKIANQIPVNATQITSVGGINVGVGIHDSSAALVPYLVTQSQPFVLISTGSWSISINPYNQAPLTKTELEKDCLCYFDYTGKPVKASRLFSGNEHNRQVKYLAKYFNKSEDYYKNIIYDNHLIKILRKKFKQILPHQTELGQLKESPFVDRNINLYRSYEEAYHQLIMDLVAQQVASTLLIIADTKPTKIVIEGGFAKNSIFLKLMSEAFFGIDIYISELTQASALGAALVIAQSWNNQSFTSKELKLIKI